MFNKLLKILLPKEAHKKEPKIIEVSDTQELSPKEIATLNNEPYIAFTKVNLDPNDVSTGEFELDWNDKFIINLMKHGYKQKETDTDADIVDRWFTAVARNVALEIAEQEMADPAKRSQRWRDIGDGYSEVK